MTEAAARLVDQISDDVMAWMSGNDVDLRARYGSAIERVGAVPVLSELFLRFEDSTLTEWLQGLGFMWTDLPFQAWQEVLRRISGHSPAIYQFIPFASRFLGLDMVRLIQDDAQVDEVGRAFAAYNFPNGGPPPGSEWVRERLAELGVDQAQLLRRLAAEGAPMRLDR